MTKNRPPQGRVCTEREVAAARPELVPRHQQQGRLLGQERMVRLRVLRVSAGHAQTAGRGAGLSPGGTLRREDEGQAQRHGPQPTAPTSAHIQAHALRQAEARNAVNAANCTVWPLVVL
ncbi:hypothetical protein PAL_GLEAN10002987 [Pteropus alecto]|uniref:Uncharacterized protein n=1 Tax=Pteropus alecto TaxID=9402 RepID=L5JZD3_PTEAL|nr:hypothetical protein PAL_GLEAN10002987 [Pteropus alecto]